jgi:hypothetical protein
MSAFNVLQHHRFDEGRFFRTSFSDDLDVREAIFVLDAEQQILAAEIGACEMGDGAVVHDAIVGCDGRRWKAAECA